MMRIKFIDVSNLVPKYINVAARERMDVPLIASLHNY